MNYLKIKNHFNSLNENEQWLWAIKNKDLIEMTLDNDNTTFVFKEEEDKTDDCTLFIFKADVGNRWGLEYLMKNLGFTIKFA